MLMEMSIVLKVFFQHRKRRISWRLCKNCEILFSGCEKSGAWFFAQKGLFTLRRHINIKTDKKHFFYVKKWWTWYPITKCSLLCHFNQLNIKRKNCVWTTKSKSLLEKCILHHVEVKIVSTFQPIKRLVSTTVKSAKPAATFCIFVWRTKYRHLCCWAAMARIALSKRGVVITELKNHLLSEETSPPITINHTRTWAKESKNSSIYGINVSTSHWLMQLTKKSFPFPI